MSIRRLAVTIRLMSAHRHLPLDDQFDTSFANQLAGYETYNKHHYRPNTYLHKWWGRRCGSTFRLILKGLVAAPDAENYYQPGGLAGKVILDPMMGGGTTLHEALRLGANVVGVDVDPIPIVQARASLTLTNRTHLERGFLDFFGQVREAVEPHFVTHCPDCGVEAACRHVLYGQRRRCGCREVLVIDSLVIRREADGRVLRFCPRCQTVHDGDKHECRAGVGRSELVERGHRRCETCDEPYLELTDEPYFARYAALAVAGLCPAHGLFYKAPDPGDLATLARADALRPEFASARASFTVTAGEKSQQLLRRGITSYLDLYSSRQLLFLEAVMASLPSDDPGLRLDLALLVSTSLEFNSMLAGYKGTETRRAGAVRHTFSHHAYAFPYTAMENNPVFPRRSSGTLLKLFYGRLLRGREWAEAPRERTFETENGTFVTIDGEKDFGTEVADPSELGQGQRRFLLRQTSATALTLPSESVDAVVTDPPYFDSIQYDDLAAYFRVWLQHMIPDAARWSSNGKAAVDTSGVDDGRAYAEQMRDIWCEVQRVLKPDDGRLVFTFHHWRAEAWASLTYALHAAGFRLINRYVVHAEHPMSVHITNMKALTHDVILVLAPDARVVGAAVWPQLTAIPGQDSAVFCEACGGLLGHLLERETLTYAESLAAWRAALSG